MSTSRIEQTFETSSVEETLTRGKRLGQALTPSTVIALSGTLGSGKTHLAKGIAAGADVPADVPVNSPTFVLINEYPGRLRLFHIDVYRLAGADDLDALGVDEMIKSGGAVLIEWANRVTDALPDDRVEIEIAITGETRRQFTARSTGPNSTCLVGAWLNGDRD